MQNDEELGLYDEPIPLSDKDVDVFVNEIETPSEPNEALIEAASQYDEDVKKKETSTATTNVEKDELSNLTKVVSRRGIDIHGDATIYGYDNTGDGLIDEFAPKSSRRAQYAKIEKPYYAKPNFNWGDRRAWINDQNAVNYWLTYVKNDKDTSYPTDFDSKTY